MDGRRTLLLLRGSEGSALGVGGHDAQIGGWRVVAVNRWLLPAVYKRVIYRETGWIMGDMTLPACRRLSRPGSDYRFLSTGILSAYASIRRSLVSLRGPEAVVKPTVRTPKHRGSDEPRKVNGLVVAGKRHWRHREGATRKVHPNAWVCSRCHSRWAYHEGTITQNRLFDPYRGLHSP